MRLDGSRCARMNDEDEESRGIRPTSYNKTKEETFHTSFYKAAFWYLGSTPSLTAKKGIKSLVKNSLGQVFLS